jgi:hypothetical protein
LELAEVEREDGYDVAFVVGETVKAVACVESIAG